MRIVSINAWGGAMYDELAAWVPAVGADVLCVQEVTRTPGATGWTRFSDADRTLPQRANLFEDLCSLLPDHRAVFLPSDAGPVTVADGSVHVEKFGVAVLVSPAVQLLAESSRFVHGSYTEHEEWAVSDRPRAAQAVRVLDPATDRTVTVVTLHGLRDSAGKGDTPARAAQAERLAELVTDVREADDLVVVCGDLNLLPDSATFAVLGRVGLTDLVGTADTRTSRYLKPLRHANYLLVSDPGAVVAFDAPATPEVSDHRPLVLDLEPGPTPRPPPQ